MRHAERGYTVLHLLCAIATALSIFGTISVILGPMLGRGCVTAVTLKDADQLRWLMNATTSLAEFSGGRFPLPSELDAGGDTAGQTRFKNRTGSIVSAMVFSGLVRPEACVSPAEVGRYRVMHGYLHSMVGCDGAIADEARGVVLNPARAVYDPRFKGTPVDVEEFLPAVERFDPSIGHVSYAHAAAAGARLDLWTVRDAAPGTPMWSTRGPRYEDRRTLLPGHGWRLCGERAAWGKHSDALLFFSRPGRWEGNVAYIDGHVAFDREAPARAELRLRTGGMAPDNLFVDELDESAPRSWAPEHIRDLAFADRRLNTRRNALLRQWKRGVPLDAPVRAEHLRAGDGAFVHIDGDTIPPP